MRKLIAVMLISGCAGHIFALPFYVAAEAAEAVCKSKLPKGTKDPNGHGLIYVCREPKGDEAGRWELIATDCSDIPPPDWDGHCYAQGDAGCAISTRCELVDGRSSWVPQYPVVFSPDAGRETGGTSQMSEDP